LPQERKFEASSLASLFFLSVVYQAVAASMTSRSASSGIASAPNDEAPQKRPRVDGAAPSAVAAAEAKDDEDEEAQPHDIDATRRAATVRLHATSGLSATAAAAATAVSASSSSSSSAHAAEERRKCPYLDTVNRHLLDTDMEKVCSVSLSNLHVYACLVCGRFFQVMHNAVVALQPCPSLELTNLPYESFCLSRGGARPRLHTPTPCRPGTSSS